VQPWITYKAIDWLNDYLTPNKSVFEWGSGHSTFYFAERVKRIISVEHNFEWYDKIGPMLNEYDNFDYFYVPIERLKIKTDYYPGSYSSKNSKYKGYSFEGYVKIIDSYPDNIFDFILIDGRSRASCVLHALNKIKSGGYLMLDNSERNHYSCILSYLSKYKKQDFYGPGRGGLEWNTTIWRIRDA
jgi:hypothetical protein